MAVIHKYLDDSGFYIVSHYKDHYNTFQITESGIKYLRKCNILSDGTQLDAGFLSLLISNNFVTTLGKGSPPIRIEKVRYNKPAVMHEQLVPRNKLQICPYCMCSVGKKNLEKHFSKCPALKKGDVAVDKVKK